jgi:hypothetical protein
VCDVREEQQASNDGTGNRWRGKREYIYTTISNHQRGIGSKSVGIWNSPHSFAHNFPTLSAIEEGERVTTTLFTVGIYFIYIVDLVLLLIPLLTIFPTLLSLIDIRSHTHKPWHPYNSSSPSKARPLWSLAVPAVCPSPRAPYCHRLTPRPGIGQAMAIALAEAGADILLVQVPQTPLPPIHLPL